MNAYAIFNDSYTQHPWAGGLGLSPRTPVRHGR